MTRGPKSTVRTLVLYAIIVQVFYISMHFYMSPYAVTSVSSSLTNADIRETEPTNADVRETGPTHADVRETGPTHADVRKTEPNSTNDEPIAHTLRQQVLRLQGVEEACRHHPKRDVTVRARDFKSLIVDTKHRLMFCLVAKIGSTSWTTLFLNQLGHPNVLPGRTIGLIKSGKLPLHYITHFNDTESQRVLREYYGIVYGRNPWRRLLSGYNDKFEDTPDRKIFHDLWGKSIIAKYRTNATEYALQHGNDVTFPEFVSWIVDTIKSGKMLDIHWKSIDEVCHLCQHRYNFLGHLEDLDQEKPLLLPLAFRDANFASVPEVHRKRRADQDAQLVHAYRDIPMEHREVLLDYYRVDFEVFRYPKEIPGM